MPIPNNYTITPDPSKKELLKTKDPKLFIVVNNLDTPPQNAKTKLGKKEMEEWNLPEQPTGYLKYTDFDML